MLYKQQINELAKEVKHNNNIRTAGETQQEGDSVKARTQMQQKRIKDKKGTLIKYQTKSWALKSSYKNVQCKVQTFKSMCTLIVLPFNDISQLW